MRTKILGMLAVGLLVGPMAAQAALVQATLNNVTIGSAIYNVTFSQLADAVVGTTFNDVFGASTPLLTFTTQADALVAVTAVRAAADALDFNYTPATDDNGFVLPFDFTDTTFSYYTGWSDDTLLGGAGVDGIYVWGPTPRVNPFSIAFATFEQVGPAPVPLPAAAWLLLSGLAGLGWMGRRKAS